MPKLTVAGHPLHPQLVGLPIGALGLACVLDWVYVLRGSKAARDASTYALITGVATGVLAGAAGATDYLDIKPRTSTKQMANLHAVLNASVLGLAALELSLRRRGRLRPALATFLSTTGFLGLTVSQWYGGHLVYDLGLRVEGKSPLADKPSRHIPGDTVIARALETLAERAAPSAGPAL